MSKQEAPNFQEHIKYEVEELRYEYRSLMEQEERWYQDFQRIGINRDNLAHLNNTRDKLMAVAKQLGVEEVVNLNWRILGERREMEEKRGEAQRNRAKKMKG